MAVLGSGFPRSKFAMEKADPAGRIAGCATPRINGSNDIVLIKG